MHKRAVLAELNWADFLLLFEFLLLVALMVVVATPDLFTQGCSGDSIEVENSLKFVKFSS